MDNNEFNKKEPFSVYCNSIEVVTGRYDISFALSQETPQGTDYLGNIVMSPEHANVFSEILINNIQNFEELFGKIPELNDEKMKKLEEEGKISFGDNNNE